MKREYRKQMEAHYKWFHRGRRCFYCGDRAATTDHIPPLISAYALGREFFDKNDIPMYKVRTCRQCNSLLGRAEIYHLCDRCNYLYDRMIRKYQYVLDNPEWTDEELRELDYSLRQYITNSETIRQWLTRRLEYMEEVHDPVSYWKIHDRKTGTVTANASSQELEYE